MHRSLGDSLMPEFADGRGCLQCALAMHAWFREGNEGLAPERQLHLRIGAHLARFLADEHDIYGTDVNLASRIAALAGAGEFVVSSALRERLGELPELPCSDLGECRVKRVREPVHAFRIGPPGAAGSRPRVPPARS